MTYDEWKTLEPTGEFWRCPVCSQVTTYGENEPCSALCEAVMYAEDEPPASEAA